MNQAEPIIFLALVAISFSSASVASAKYTGLPTKAGLESHRRYVQTNPQQPLVQSTGHSASAQTPQVNYAPVPVRPSYPTKYRQLEILSAPAKGRSLVKRDTRKVILSEQNSSFPKQLVLMENATHLWLERTILLTAVLKADVCRSFSSASVASAKTTGLPTEAGFESHKEHIQASPQQPLVQSTSHSAPVQTEFRQPEILQAPVETQQVSYALAPVHPSHPTKGSLEYAPTSQQSFVSTPVQQSSFAASIMGNNRQLEILSAPAKGRSLVKRGTPVTFHFKDTLPEQAKTQPTFWWGATSF